MAADLPIDIQYNKLTDWLIDRKWVPRGFQDESRAVRELISGAIEKMPDVAEITSIIKDAYITPFHIFKIVELLKRSEERSFFGSYTTDYMTQFVEIERRYKAGNIYLGEASQIFIHNVDYEIPACKRVVSRGQAKLADMERKQAQCLANAGANRTKFKAQCSDMRIAGSDVAAELAALVSQLPVEFDKVVNTVQSEPFGQAMAYYRAFLDFTLEGKSAGSDALKLLAVLRERGNISVHEYKTGQPLPAEGATAGGAGGAAEATGGDDGGIDWGDTPAADDGGGIDWGDTPAADDGGGIDWGDTPATGASSSSTSGPAAVVTRDSLLMHSATRNEILDQLLELEGFLTQRKAECSMEVDIISINQFQHAPSIIQLQTKDSVEKLLASVTSAVHLLTNQRVQQLLLIHASPKYVDRLAKSLKQKLELADKLVEKAEELKALRSSTQAEVEAASAKARSLIAQSKALKADIERDLSSKYDNRRVNLIGGAALVS